MRRVRLGGRIRGALVTATLVYMVAGQPGSVAERAGFTDVAGSCGRVARVNSPGEGDERILSIRDQVKEAEDAGLIEPDTTDLVTECLGKAYTTTGSSAVAALRSAHFLLDGAATDGGGVVVGRIRDQVGDLADTLEMLDPVIRLPQVPDTPRSNEEMDAPDISNSIAIWVGSIAALIGALAAVPAAIVAFRVRRTRDMRPIRAHAEAERSDDVTQPGQSVRDRDALNLASNEQGD